ncbi:MAG: DUF3782 domain-containing protein [Thermofilaceae archaeon]
MVETLKEELLRLLLEDRAFRLAVTGALGLAEAIDEIKKLRRDTARNTKAIRVLQEQVAEHSKAIRALQEQVAEHTKAIRALQEQVARNTEAIRALQEQVVEHTKILAEQTRAIRALQEQVAEHTKAIRALQEQAEHLSRSVEDLARTVAAVGARYGLLAEEAFREAMRGIVEKLFGGKVERWIQFDEEGMVFGHPSVVEADLVVRDKEHVLIELKASASRSDVRELVYVGKLYEKVTGVKPRLALVSPHIDPRALELARKLGVEVYTGTTLER